MVLNKKGIAFTIITIAILSMFAASYGTYNLIKDRSSINKRITTLNNFVISVEKDLSRKLYISGYRAIFLFNKHIVENNTYIGDVNNSINEIFFSGSIGGNPEDLMQDATFTEIQRFLSINANRTNAKISLLDPKIELTQEDPWNLKIILNITINITDKTNLVSWNRPVSIESYIPILNLQDPLYSKETGGQIIKTITPTPYSIFVSTGNYDNLTSHFENSYYKASILAPSYLNRLEGNFSADPNGIESLVHPTIFANTSIVFKPDKSVVDYIYFSDNNPLSFTTSVSNLRLDGPHCPSYNLTIGVDCL